KTKEIARRAAIPVGTLYQFFPNRDAVLMELARAQLAEFDARFRPALADASVGEGSRELLGRLLGSLRDAYVKTPGLAMLVGTTQGHRELEPIYARHNDVVAGWVAMALH